MRRRVSAAMDRIVRHIESLPRQPAADVEGGAALARSLAEPLPEAGAPFESLLDVVFDRAAPRSFNTAGPGYLAYIPGGGIFDSAVADLVADALNRYVGVWLAAPGLAQLEANVVRWFADIVGYPKGALGILTSGGSLANFTAVVTARRERLPPDFLQGVLYASDQVHHSVEKAALLAGFPPGNVGEVPTDARFRVDLAALRSAIAADRARGRVPFLVVGNAGTTNTGAVDDLEALAGLAASEGLWLHVDAAYGGFFLLTERGRRVLKGIERADSVTLDPHKGLFLPYGTGSLVVKDGAALRRAHSVKAEYLPTLQEDEDLVDFNEISPELSRGFRGLRVWLPVKLHGIGVFRRALDEKLDLAAWAAGELRAVPGIEMVAPPDLSLLAFRLVKAGLDGAALDELNRRFLERINARRRVYMTGTVAKGVFLVRICVLSFRTHADRMRDALDDIQAAAAEVMEPVDLASILARHQPADQAEADDLRRICDFVARHHRPFDRSIAEGHLTGSAITIARSGDLVLLLHHRKLERWLQPGGHADPGETEGEQVALREALEETGLAGLALHPAAPRPLDVDVHEIPARQGEPAHLHLDLRYLVTAPDDAVPSRAAAEARALRWFRWDEVDALDLDPGLRRALRKARAFWGDAPPPGPITTR